MNQRYAPFLEQIKNNDKSTKAKRSNSVMVPLRRTGVWAALGVADRGTRAGSICQLQREDQESAYLAIYPNRINKPLSFICDNLKSDPHFPLAMSMFDCRHNLGTDGRSFPYSYYVSSQFRQVGPFLDSTSKSDQLLLSLSIPPYFHSTRRTTKTKPRAQLQLDRDLVHEVKITVPECLAAEMCFGFTFIYSQSLIRRHFPKAWDLYTAATTVLCVIAAAGRLP
jgi:hypothetical protein